jgi:hypothetical protein
MGHRASASANDEGGSFAAGRARKSLGLPQPQPISFMSRFESRAALLGDGHRASASAMSFVGWQFLYRWLAGKACYWLALLAPMSLVGNAVIGWQCPSLIGSIHDWLAIDLCRPARLHDPPPSPVILILSRSHPPQLTCPSPVPLSTRIPSEKAITDNAINDGR